MQIGRRAPWLARAAVGATVAFAWANVSLTTLSTDPFSNTTSAHKTEVEPDTFSFGTTMVSAFQVGRFSDGGASDIGWATSTNNGDTWTISTSFTGSGSAHPVFAVAVAPSGSTLNEVMDSPASGLPAVGGQAVVDTSGQAVPNAASDHAAPQAALTNR